MFELLIVKKAISFHSSRLKMKEIENESTIVNLLTFFLVGDMQSTIQ